MQIKISELKKISQPFKQEVYRCTICHKIWPNTCGCEKKNLIKGSAMRLRTLKTEHIELTRVLNVSIFNSAFKSYLNLCAQRDIVELVIDNNVQLVMQSIESKDRYLARFNIWQAE